MNNQNRQTWVIFSMVATALGVVGAIFWYKKDVLPLAIPSPLPRPLPPTDPLIPAPIPPAQEVALPAPKATRLSAWTLPSLLTDHRLQLASQILGIGLALWGIWTILTTWRPIGTNIPGDWDYRKSVLEGMFWVVAAAFVYTGHRFAKLPRFSLAVPQRGLPLFIPSLLAVAIIFRLVIVSTPTLNVWGFTIDEAVRRFPSRNTQMVVYFGALGLFVLGTMRWREPLEVVQGLWRDFKQNWPEWALVLVLTLVGFAVRVYQLDETIPAFHSDEPAFVHHYRMIYQGEPYAIGQDIFLGQTALGAYFSSYALDLFGATMFAARFSVVVIGTLAIPGTYLMGRRLWNPWVGILAALALVSNPVHIHFSRDTIYNIWDPTIGVYAVLLMWSGLERGGRWKFALAGCLIGVDQFMYTASRLWLVLIPLWIACLVLRHPRKMLAQWDGLALFAAGILVALMPMIGFIRVGLLTFSQHSLDVSHGYGSDNVFDTSASDYVKNWLQPALAAFLDQGDFSQHYEIEPYTAMLLRWGFLLTSLGIAVSLRYLFDAKMLFVVLWIALTIVLGGSLTHYVGFTRYVIMLVPLAVIIGVGTAYFAEMLRPFLPHRAYPVVILLAFGGVLRMNVEDIDFYYSVHNPRYVLDQGNEVWVVDTLPQQTHALIGPETTVYWVVHPVPTDDGGVAFFFNQRVEEIYRYYYGRMDYILHDQVPTREWLQGLDRSKDIYMFITPTVNDRQDDFFPPAYDSDYWIIKDVFPEASYLRYDGTTLPSRYEPVLFTRVFIPKLDPQ